MNHIDDAKTSDLQTAEGESTLVDFLIVLAKHKKMLLGLPLAIAVLAGAVSFIVPNTYSASVKLMPPQQAQSGAAALLSQLGGAASAVASSAGMKNPNDMYIGMLKSRTIADRLIAQFDLKRIYDTNSLDKARIELANNTSVSSGKDGLIVVAVDDHDKRLVAPLANAYVAELVKLTKTLAVTEASQRRMFYEQQLEQAKNNLANVELSLNRALDTHGVVSVDANSRTIIETVARLRAEISAKEIQINAMRAFVTTENPGYKRAKEELDSFRAELSRLENGRSDTKNSNGQTPDGLENIKTLRDVKYYQMLYEILAKQYEVARLDEAKDVSMIQVLDPAIEPERKSSPKRALVVVLAGVVGLLIAFCLVLMREVRANLMSRPNGRAKWALLVSYLRMR